MLKITAIFLLAITVLLAGCANEQIFPAANNTSQVPEAGNFYPEDSSTSHNFGPGY